MDNISSIAFNRILIFKTYLITDTSFLILLKHESAFSNYFSSKFGVCSFFILTPEKKSYQQSQSRCNIFIRQFNNFDMEDLSCFFKCTLTLLKSRLNDPQKRKLTVDSRVNAPTNQPIYQTDKLIKTKRRLVVHDLGSARKPPDKFGIKPELRCDRFHESTDMLFSKFARKINLSFLGLNETRTAKTFIAVCAWHNHARFIT